MVVGCVPSAAVAVCSGVGGLSAPVHAGICLPRRGCLPGRGVCPSACWDMSAGGCLPSACWDPPVNRMTDRLTGVKTLPCRNYVADGKYPTCHGKKNSKTKRQRLDY